MKTVENVGLYLSVVLFHNALLALMKIRAYGSKFAIINLRGVSTVTIYVILLFTMQTYKELIKNRLK